MTIYAITTKTDTQSSVGPVVINVETNVVNLAAQAADYIPETYIDLSNLAGGDTTIVTEYIGVDGSNLRVYYQQTFTDVQSSPIVRFHGKMMELNMLYRITVKQTAGTGRAYPYSSVLQVFNA